MKISNPDGALVIDLDQQRIVIDETKSTFQPRPLVETFPDGTGWDDPYYADEQAALEHELEIERELNDDK